MFERYDIGEQAVILHANISQEQDENDLREFISLVHSANIDILDIVSTTLRTPSAKYFIGSGKAKELAAVVSEQRADVVLVNHALTPSQERNLEQICQCRVVDRTGVILDIFAQRARTHEGKLQVELAQLQHLTTRLVRGWTHLERQKGGIGLRGPGETQLETDRRLLRKRVQFILSRLQKVEKQRSQNRKSREKADIPTVSLVGYTNAGKSTLFNLLTAANSYAADQLFATLDPTLRRIQIADVGQTAIVDTVGFIRHLPYELVAAFKATLQETQQATLLLHIIDATDSNYHENIDAVNGILTKIDAQHIPVLHIMNKIDKLNLAARIERNEQQLPVCVWLSAQTGEGIDLLHQALQEHLANEITLLILTLPPAFNRLRSLLYQHHAIQAEKINTDGSMELNIRIPTIEWNRLCKQEYDLLYLADMTHQ